MKIAVILYVKVYEDCGLSMIVIFPSQFFVWTPFFCPAYGNNKKVIDFKY